MSIYPVRAKTWWVVIKSDPKEMQEQIKMERDFCKSRLKTNLFTCQTCGKTVTDWDKCYLSHAFAMGFDGAYCNKKCYDDSAIGKFRAGLKRKRK